MLADLVGQQRGTALVGQCREQRRLAAGSGAKVGPRAGVIGHGRLCEHAGHELGTGVLDTHRSLPRARDAVDVSPGADRAVRDQVTGFGACCECGLERADTGQGHEVHTGRLVVRFQQGLDLRGVSAVGAQGPAQRANLPHRVGVADTELPQLVGVLGGERVQPFVVAAPGHLAQDGVDESRGSLPDLPAHQTHGRVQRGVIGDAHREQLVHAQAQGVQHRGVQLVQRAVHALPEHGVPRATPPHGPVGELGRERRVPLVEAVFTDQAWQHEVPVGVLRVDRAQGLICGQPCGIGALATLRGRVRGVRALVLGPAVALVALGVATRAVPRSPIPPAGLPGRAVVTTAPTGAAGRAVVAAPAAGITERTIVTTAVVPPRPVVAATGVAAVLLVPTHPKATCSVFCLPRAQSRAAMSFLPLGCTRVSSTA